MAARPTILDVAQAAGVSTATVSRVINGATTVDRELSRRVRAAVRSTGYVPNAAGRSLRRRESTQIAVVAPDSANPYFMQVIGEVERIARNSGYSVAIVHTDDDLDLERESLAQLVGRQVAGVIVAAVDEASSDLSALVDAQMPLVLLDRQVRGVTADLVTTDNIDAGEQAARHLLEQGFHRPAVISGPAELSTTEDRARGFLEAWAAQHDPVPRERVLRGDLHLESGAEAMGELLAAGEVDSVFVTNNRMSAGVFEAMRGVDGAPALLATDDDLWTRLVTPSISVVQQPVRSTGRAAAKMLGERIASPAEPTGVTRLRSRIVARESTAGGPGALSAPARPSTPRG